jgi:hypothetical protein
MKKSILGIISTIFLLVVFTGIVNATEANLLVYLVVFLLLFIIFSLAIGLVLRVAYGAMHKASRIFISFVLAFIPTGILALSSLSSVTVMDFALVLAIPILLVWYGLKNNLIK